MADGTLRPQFLLSERTIKYELGLLLKATTHLYAIIVHRNFRDQAKAYHSTHWFFKATDVNFMTLKNWILKSKSWRGYIFLYKLLNHF